MSLVKIGFFSLKDHTGCSSFAIHAANYIAGGDNSVAVIEPDTVLEPQYADVQVEKNEDGSFEFCKTQTAPVIIGNNRRYFNLWFWQGNYFPEVW